MRSLGRLLFARRGRSVASGTALSLASATMVAFAVNAHGFPTRHVSLNDGGVWVTSDQTGPASSSPHGAFARYNKPIGHFDAAFSPPGAAQTSYNVDVFQNGSIVLARDLASGKLYRVDVALQIADPTQSASVPDADEVALGGSTVAVVDPASGKLWISDANAIAGLSLDAKPVATAGGGAAVAVSADGEVFVASAAKHQVLAIRPAVGRPPVVTTTSLPLGLSDLALATVGSAPVVLDQTTGVVFLPDGASVHLPQGDGGFVLQQSGPGNPAALVADARSVYSIPLKGRGYSTVASSGTGEPARPVRADGCFDAAWAGGSGALTSDCGGKTTTYPLGVMGARGGHGLVFRVNRNIVVLNDPVTGAVADVSGDPVRVDDWADVTADVENADQGPQTRKGNQNNPNSGHRAMKAVADTLGARPGRVTILHVLDNDAAPDNDILAVSSITTPDNSAVTAAVTPDGQAIAITVPATVTGGDIHFTYDVTDEKGQSSSAPVTVQIRGPDRNEVPAQRPGLATKTWNVGPSGVFSYPVLSDWRDFDGDSLVVRSVKAAAGAVTASADGRITFTAPATPGPQTITYQVWDGVGDPVTGTLAINVLGPNAAAVPATAEPDVARAFVGQPVTISPLANDIAGADPSNPQAHLALSGTITSPAGATVTTNADGTVGFTASQPGVFNLTYHVAFGSARTADGQIRVDAAQPPGDQGAPVAMPDTAVLKGQEPSTVDVLANDTDSAGALLTVESAAPADEKSGLQVSVVSGRWLRIVATTPDIGRPQIVDYTVTDGTSPPVTGEVRVTQLPAPNDDALPIARDDTAIVRAGDVTSVDVLSNDTNPDGGALSLAQGGLTAQPALGGAYASGAVVRYAAPASVPSPTYVVVDYVVQNASGGSATGHVDITVMPVDAAHDSPPHPESVEARVAAGGTVTISVPIYNVDPDGDSVSLIGVSKAPRLGQILSSTRDSFVYQAYATSAGTDVFDYQVEDRFGEIGAAQARISVVPAGAPQSPVASDDALTAAPGANLHIDVLANDFIPTGDHVTIEPLAQTNQVVPAGVTLDGTLVRVKAPAAGAPPVVVSYGVTDGTGAVSIASVTVRSQAGFDIPPIARDDTVDTLPSGATVTVAVTDNDDDPQGDRSDLTVTKVFDPQVTISGSSLIIPIESYPQSIGYQITDPAGSTAMAVVYVPGRSPAAAPPKLKPDIAPVEIPFGGTKTISINDYVVDPRGKAVRLTTNDKISGSPADALQAHSKGATTLELKSVGKYSGAGAVTFEVTDGSTLSDPAGLKAVLTIPVKIGAAPPSIACPSTPVQLTAGGTAVSVDITALCQVTAGDPSVIPSLKYTSSLSGLSAVKLAASGSNHQLLQLTAGAEAKPNATGVISVGIEGSSARATLNVVVVAAPPASVKAMAIGGVKAGSAATVDVASYVQSPFGAAATIQVLSVTQTSKGFKATTAVNGTKVSITPPADSHGTFTFTVSVTDLASQPDRAVQGTITMEVLGVPGATGAPTLSKVSSHTVVLAFTAPAPNGSPVDKYEISDSTGKTYACAAAPCTVSGLVNGRAYTFTVRAHNEVGWGPASPASAPATPDQVPDAVSGVTAKAADGSVSLQWSAPHVDGSPISGYDVQISPDPGTGPKQTTSGTSLTWTGLSNGTQYTFVVRADNAAGAGQFSGPAQATPFGQPKTMAAPTASAADSADRHEKAVTVSWAAADGNGRDITGYTVTTYHNGSAAGTTSVPSNQTSASFTVSNDGSTYQYSVTATNAGGLTSAASPESTPPITAASTPDTISGVTATAGDSKVDVSFTLPAPNGARITGVNYSVSDGGPSGSWSVTGSPGTSVKETIDGLENGTSYTVAISACNEAGQCGAWAASNAVTPFGKPFAPSGVKASSSGQDITVSWNANKSNGVAIDHYTVTWSGGSAKTTSGTSYAFKSLAAGTKYTFSVTATDKNGQTSDPSSQVSATTAKPAPPPPTVSISLGAAAPIGQWINVSVSGFSPNTTYTVTYCDSGGCNDWMAPGQGFTTSISTGSDGSGYAGGSPSGAYCKSGGHVNAYVLVDGHASNTICQ